MACPQLCFARGQLIRKHPELSDRIGLEYVDKTKKEPESKVFIYTPSPLSRELFLETDIQSSTASDHESIPTTRISRQKSIHD